MGTSMPDDAPGQARRPSRQQPGLACEQCRKRKLRCDRQQPECSACIEAGVSCFTNRARQPRGPKKGSRQALQQRLEALEQRLASGQSTLLDTSDFSLDNVDNAADDAFFEEHRRYSSPDASTTDLWSTMSAATTNSEDLGISMAMASGSSSASLGTSTPILSMGLLDSPVTSELIQADLDQLFFDRVYPSIPILNQHRYLVQAREKQKSKPFVCLQHALWTLAACFSTQFHPVGEALYTYTRQLLEEPEDQSHTPEASSFEQTQAWILLTVCEFLRFPSQRAWLSAGRSFRLVQLMKLYEIDAVPAVYTDWVQTETMRRTFWAAFCLDRLTSIHSGLPLALGELVILTRLPAPEENFQSGSPVLTHFLSDAMVAGPHERLPVFSELIVFVALFGRIQSHRHQCSMESVYGNVPQDFWDRHDWLNLLVTQRMEAMTPHTSLSSSSKRVEPILAFGRMMAHGTIVALCQAMDSMMWTGDDYRSVINDFQLRALTAAREILLQAKSLDGSSLFKAHPFTPMPLRLCAEFLVAHAGLDDAVFMQIEEVVDCLRAFKTVNVLAQDCLRSLGRDNIIEKARTMSTAA